jgi:hypothetical protein
VIILLTDAVSARFLGSCLPSSHTNGQTEEENLDEDNLSLYHRKLLATPPIQAEKPEWLIPWNTSTLEQRRMWPTWWNSTMEAKLQDEVIVGIVTTSYVC